MSNLNINFHAGNVLGVRRGTVKVIDDKTKVESEKAVTWLTLVYTNNIKDDWFETTDEEHNSIHEKFLNHIIMMNNTMEVG